MQTNVTQEEYTEDRKVFCRRLKKLREENHLSKMEMAALMDISRVSYSYYESGERLPSGLVLANLSQNLKAQKGINISLDYLLGCIDTPNIEYAEINQTIGLSENTIKSLSMFKKDKRQETLGLIDFMIQEEPDKFFYAVDEDEIDYSQMPPPHMPQPGDDDYEDYIQQLYEEDLAFQEFEKKHEMEQEEEKKKSIFDHIGSDWKQQDYIKREEEIDKELSSEELYKKYCSEERDESYERYMANNTPDDEMVARAMKEAREYDVWLEAEDKKSNLLSCIKDYIAYNNGCFLCDSNNNMEPLSEEHLINIGIGNNKTLKFPSKESDELVEFMLIQKVIDALRILKRNYHQQLYKENK